MKLIDDTEFLVIDFETITPKGRPPEPIEVGILRIKQNKIDNNASIDWLIKPPEGLHLTRFDTSQTGITEQDLMRGIDAKRAMRIIDKSCSKKDYVFTVNLVLIMERNVETRIFPSNPIAEGF